MGKHSDSHTERMAESYEQSLEPEPTEPPHTAEAYTRYVIDDRTPYKGKVVVLASTNDDGDTGYPGKWANWEMTFNSIEDAIKTTGITRPGMHSVYVSLFGRPLLTPDIELHRKAAELTAIQEEYVGRLVTLRLHDNLNLLQNSREMLEIAAGLEKDTIKFIEDVRENWEEFTDA